MIAVREFEPDDLEALVELCRTMWHEAPEYRDYPFRPSKIAQWGQLCLTSNDWLCILALEEVDGAGACPIGFLAAGAVEMLFCELKTVDDIGFYVVPERRGTSAAVRMLRYLEGWAAARSVAIRMGITTGTNVDPATRFLNRFGYRQSGVLLTKPI